MIFVLAAAGANVATTALNGNVEETVTDAPEIVEETTARSRSAGWGPPKVLAIIAAGS